MEQGISDTKMAERLARDARGAEKARMDMH